MSANTNTSNIDFRNLITKKVLADYFCGGSDDCLVVFQDGTTEIRRKDISTPDNMPIASAECIGIENINLDSIECWADSDLEVSPDGIYTDTETGRVLGDKAAVIRSTFESGDYDDLFFEDNADILAMDLRKSRGDACWQSIY